jgi:D-sedoheptulose 7-phosphate isomerase
MSDQNTLTASILRKSRESQETKETFFVENAPVILECAGAMTRAFAAGGKLLAFGNGGSALDAEHCVVEFMHPIIEKRQSLPAVALTVDSALMTAIGNDEDFSLVFAKQIRLIGRPGDIAVGISTSGKSASVVEGLRAAREAGLLTVAFSGRDGGKLPAASDFCFTVKSFSIHRIQETHESLLHILWDMIHVMRGAEDVIG